MTELRYIPTSFNLKKDYQLTVLIFTKNCVLNLLEKNGSLTLLILILPLKKIQRTDKEVIDFDSISDKEKIILYFETKIRRDFFYYI